VNCDKVQTSYLQASVSKSKHRNLERWSNQESCQDLSFNTILINSSIIFSQVQLDVFCVLKWGIPLGNTFHRITDLSPSGGQYCLKNPWTSRHPPSWCREAPAVGTCLLQPSRLTFGHCRAWAPWDSDQKMQKVNSKSHALFRVLPRPWVPTFSIPCASNWFKLQIWKQRGVTQLSAGIHTYKEMCFFPNSHPHFTVIHLLRCYFAIPAAESTTSPFACWQSIFGHWALSSGIWGGCSLDGAMYHGGDASPLLI